MALLLTSALKPRYLSCFSFFTSDLCRVESTWGQFSPQGSTEYQFFMNLLQIFECNLRDVFTWAAAVIRVSRPSYVQHEYLPGALKWNSLLGYAHFSTGSDSSERNTNPSPKCCTKYSHKTCQLLLLPFTSICSASQTSARWVKFNVGMGCSRINVSVMFGLVLNPPGAASLSQRFPIKRC